MSACPPASRGTGKSFFKKKKQPIPVDLKASDFPGTAPAEAVSVLALNSRQLLTAAASLVGSLIRLPQTAAATQPIPHAPAVAAAPCLLTAQVKSAVEATYMVPPSGTCVSVRVARSSMPADAIAANTLAALQGVVKNIPKKWANVQVGVCCSGRLWVGLPVVATE